MSVFLLDHLSLVIQGITYIGSVGLFRLSWGAVWHLSSTCPCGFFETRVLCKMKKGRRVLSLIAAILCIIGVILLVCGLIIPELADTMYRLSLSVPGFIQSMQDYIENMSRDNPRIHSYVMSLDVNWNQIGGQLMGYFQTWATNLLNSTVSIISSAVQVIVSFALGFVFALNALLKKETLAVQVKKLLLAFLPLKVVKHIVRIGRLSNQAFSNFLSGQCIEAVILGCLIFTCMKILGMPYAVLIAVFIGVSSLIPIVGAFVGCGIGVLLILTVDWKQAVIFVIMFLVVQQFEGNVIYPHVVGNSVGLPGMWVLVAVTIGGNVAGVVGNAVQYSTVFRVYQLLTEGVNWQIEKKEVWKKLCGKYKAADFCS